MKTNNTKITKYDDIVQKLNDIPREYESNWKEIYQFYPEVIDLSYEERRKWDDFAWKILEHSIGNINLEEMCNISYDTGYKEGVGNSKDSIKDKLINRLNKTITEVINNL